MTKENQLFIQLIRLAVTGEEHLAEQIDAQSMRNDADWDHLFSLARKNHLEALIFLALPLLHHVPQEAKKQFHNAYLKMFARNEQQQYWIDRVQQLLQEAGIPFALLKGSILKDSYPLPEVRYKTDIDIYIRPEDRSAIRALLEKNGGEFQGTESGDEQFTFSKLVGFEFHGRLLYRKTKTGIENYPDWSFVDTENNRLTEEGYALNLIGHAVGDLARCGPGIRYILDLWIYRSNHLPQPDWESVWDRLKRDGIFEAAKNLTDLAEWLFGDGQSTPLLEELADYILQGGLYGDSARGSAVEAALAGGKGKAFARQFFRSRKEFENRFPWLKKWPFLLPVAWIIRLFQTFRHHKKAVRHWKNRIQSVSERDIALQQDRMRRFGL